MKAFANAGLVLALLVVPAQALAQSFESKIDTKEYKDTVNAHYDVSKLGFKKHGLEFRVEAAQFVKGSVCDVERVDKKTAKTERVKDSLSEADCNWWEDRKSDYFLYRAVNWRPGPVHPESIGTLGREQMECVAKAVGEANKAIAKGGNAAFLKELKVDQVVVRLDDNRAHEEDPRKLTYGPSIYDDPIFKVNAILSSSSNAVGDPVCTFADANAIDGELKKWRKTYAAAKKDALDKKVLGDAGKILAQIKMAPPFKADPTVVDAAAVKQGADGPPSTTVPAPRGKPNANPGQAPK